MMYVSHVSYEGFVDEPLFTRETLVRAVLAEQWAVAMTLAEIQSMRVYDDTGRQFAAHWDDGYDRALEVVADAIAELPCAVDVVAERYPTNTRGTP